MLHSRLFRVLLCIDVAFIALHLILLAADKAGISEMEWFFNVGSESSIPSLYLHCKWLAAAVLFSRSGRHGGGVAAYALALVAWLLFLDDTLQIHEGLGDLFARVLNLPPLLDADPDDLGELIAVGGIGLICIMAMGVALWHSAPIDRRLVLVFIGLFILLGCFGVGVDLLHAAMPDHLGWALGTLEDGAEIILGSAMVALAAAILRHVDMQPELQRARKA